MSTVKYDNELRDKIEGMKDVPSAFTFNPSAKWQHLENRLQPAPNKKKFAWWYWAAASLFIAFSTLLWLNSARQIGIATVSDSPKIITHQTNKIQQNAIAKQSQKHENISLKMIAILVNNGTAAIVKADTIEVINKTTIAASNSIIVNVINANFVDSIVQNSNLKTQIVATNIKPKRKVIHINEFGEAITQPMLATRNEYKQTVEQEDNTPPVDTNKSWWVFKAKPVSANTFTNTSITNNQ